MTILSLNASTAGGGLLPYLLEAFPNLTDDTFITLFPAATPWFDLAQSDCIYTTMKRGIGRGLIDLAPMAPSLDGCGADLKFFPFDFLL